MILLLYDNNNKLSKCQILLIFLRYCVGSFMHATSYEVACIVVLKMQAYSERHVTKEYYNLLL